MTTVYDPLTLADVRAMLAAVPAGVKEPEGLTWTRLNADGGALHTGGEGGIVYAACEVAGVSLCPEERDPTMYLIARAPSALVIVIGALEMACQYAVERRQERDDAREVLADTSRMLDQAREAIDEALQGVDEYDSHSGWWWDGAVKAISALRQAAE